MPTTNSFLPVEAMISLLIKTLYREDIAIVEPLFLIGKPVLGNPNLIPFGKGNFLCPIYRKFACFLERQPDIFSFFFSSAISTFPFSSFPEPGT
ncbi:MAG: hypothetical protein H6573_32830 [Lewinellaceae bacterium]|nr:hypothetical protein [Lewinellaceae bacterium]